MSELGKVFEEALRLERAGEPGVLATLVEAAGSTPRHGVARMVVRRDGSVVGTIGGGAVEHEMVRRALGEVLPREQPVLAETTLEAIGMVCGGKVRVLLEPLGVQPHLVLFGAGHVAAEVAPLAARCGFKVHVVDDRPEFACSERFPDAASFKLSFEPSDWNDLPLGPKSYAVVVTRGHEHDYRVVRWLCGQTLCYVGMMGSGRKVAHTMQRLAEEGLEAEAIARIRAPVGLPIRSETPAEIAVSIVGQLIQVRRGAAGE